MFARALLVLVSTISTVCFAGSGQVLVKYRDFKGPRCVLAPDKEHSMLYLERDFVAGNIRVGGGSGNLDTHALILEQAEIPLAAAKDKLRISFRGHHNIYSENIYYVDEALTREGLATLETGRWKSREFTTSIVNARGIEEKSKCVLILDFLQTN